MENSSLQHHGVRGMKWGVRRYQNSDGTLTEAGKKRYAKELAKVEAEKKILKNRARTQAKIDKLNAMRKENEEQNSVLNSKGLRFKPKTVKPKPEKEEVPKKKTIADLSDEELTAIVKRAELEKRYRDLHPKQVSAGEKFLKETLLPKATQTITTLATDYAMKKGREYLGLSSSDPTAKLKKEVERLTLEKRYKDLTNGK